MITRRSGYLSSIALDAAHRRGIASFYRKRVHDVRMSLHNKHKQVAPIQMPVAAKEPLTDDGTKKTVGDTFFISDLAPHQISLAFGHSSIAAVRLESSCFDHGF